MERYVLSQPIEFDGEKITEINMDLEGLTAVALEKAERQARLLLGKRENMFVPETNKKYLSCVAAKAAGVKVDLIKALRGKDYTQVCLLVQNFLLDGESDSEEEDPEDNDLPVNTETKNLTRTTMPEDGSMESHLDLNP